MITRFRMAFGLGLLLSLITSLTVLAKGGFDFITITGPDSKEPVQVTDTALTEDFFTFANFHEDRTKAPADPGEGYEITRFYAEGIGDRAFDRLHYYPESGFVYYDGIVNGSSEYDGGWYTANPEIKPIFESALAAQSGQAAQVEKREPVIAVSESVAKGSPVQTHPAASGVQSLPVTFIVVASGLIAFAGLAALAMLTFRRRKHSVQ